MSDKLKVSKIAKTIAAHNALNMEAKVLHDALFQNQWELLQSDTLLEPNYLMTLSKEKFYKRGGDPLKAYSVGEYADLMSVPVDVVAGWVEKKPEFFVWLHQKRTFGQEINSILLVMSHGIANDFKKSNTSLRDKSQAMNTLSKFSDLMSPKREEVDEVDKLLEGITEPEQVADLIASFGFVKADEVEAFNEDRINVDKPLVEDEEIGSLEELVTEDV